MAFRGGCYADFLPAWLDTFGTERLHVMFRGARRRSGAAVRPDSRRGWDSTPRAFPADALSSENRTTGFKSKSFQRFALKATTGSSSVLRRHPDAKRKLRAFYYRLNGQPTEETIPDVGARRARGALPRNRTRGSPRSSTPPGSQLPAWLTRPARGQTS